MTKIGCRVIEPYDKVMQYAYLLHDCLQTLSLMSLNGWAATSTHTVTGTTSGIDSYYYFIRMLNGEDNKILN